MQRLLQNALENLMAGVYLVMKKCSRLNTMPTRNPPTIIAGISTLLPVLGPDLHFELIGDIVEGTNVEDEA